MLPRCRPHSARLKWFARLNHGAQRRQMSTVESTQSKLVVGALTSTATASSEVPGFIRPAQRITIRDGVFIPPVEKYRLHTRFWHNKRNHRQFLDWFAEYNGINGLEGWYNVQGKAIRAAGGAPMLHYYQESLLDCLKFHFPEHEWLEWRFNIARHGFWNSLENQRRFMTWAAEKLDVKSMDGWYKVSQEDLIKIGGSRILTSHKSTLSRLLHAVFPEHEWCEWKFERIRRGFWNDVENHKKYMDWAGRELNVKSLDDWYSITPENFGRLEGSSLLKCKYDNSFIKCLSSVYSNHKWQEWRFGLVSLHFWDDPANPKRFFEWVEEDMNLSKLEDWYAVGRYDIQVRGGSTLMLRKPLAEWLKELHPSHNWEASLFKPSATTTG